MRIPPRRAVLVPLLILTALPAAASTPAVIERELRFDAARFSLVERDGETVVEMKGASREFTPGRPDLPAEAAVRARAAPVPVRSDSGKCVRPQTYG